MKRKSFAIPLVVVLLVIILIVAGVIFVVLGTELFKSNKELFLKYFSENAEIMEIFEKGEALESYSRKLKNTPYTSEGKLQLDENLISTTENLEKVKASNISFTGSTDVTNSYDYKNIKLNYSDSSNISIEYIKTNDHYGIKFDEIVNKFIAFENNNLKEFAKNYGIDEKLAEKIPDKLDLNRYDYSKIFTDEEKETIKSNYSKIIIDNLNDDMFSKSDNVGDKVYTIKLTKTQLRKIVTEILNKLKDDELIIGKAKKALINDFSVSEEEATEYITKFQEAIQKTIEEENSEVSETDENNNETDAELTINVHVNNKKLVKTEVLVENANFQILKTDSGVTFEYLNNDEQIFLVNFEKTTSVDIIKFLIKASYKNNEILSGEINISGLNTLDEVKEDYSFTINVGEEKLGYKYVGSNKFTPSIEKNITTQDMYSINKMNIDQLTKLTNQISKKVTELNNTRKTAAGIQSNVEPITYLLPGLIPYGAMKYLTSDGKIQTVGLIGGIATYGIISSSGLMTDNYAENTAENADLSKSTTEVFNSKWEPYVGENKKVSEIYTLLSSIVASNASNSAAKTNHIISITYSGLDGETKTYSKETEISGFLKEFGSSMKNKTDNNFTVTYQKDSEGLINSIIILEFPASKVETENVQNVTNEVNSVNNEINNSTNVITNVTN